MKLKHIVVICSLFMVAGSIGGPMFGGTTSNPGYYTIVVFGDTQDAMDDYNPSGVVTDPNTERYAEFVDSIDWIVANEKKENIAAVLHVGDAIQHCVGLPPTDTELTECDFENGAPYTDPDGTTCYGFLANEVGCKAQSGCYWTTNDGDGAGCASCQMVERATVETQGFLSQWFRFLPGGDLATGIPALWARGNHDCTGTQYANDPDREPQGYNQLYSSAVLDGLDNDYGIRRYEHVASFSDSVTGDGHAWITGFGVHPLLVVSIACCSLEGTPDAQEVWAIDIMNDYPTIPALLLVHHANAVDNTITLKSGEVAPNLFAVVGGHDGNRLQTLVLDSASVVPNQKTVLRSETDWTNPSGTPSNDHDQNGIVQNDYITLIRVYYEDEPEAIEAFGFSVAGNSRHAASTNTVVKQPLNIIP